MVSFGRRVKIVNTGLIFIDSGVKVNAAYYRLGPDFLCVSRKRHKTYYINAIFRTVLQTYFTIEGEHEVICALSKGNIKTKFHYASWFGAGSKLVRSQIPLRYLARTSFEPASNQLRTSSEAAPNQFRTSFEPDSVMEFGREPASSC